ncbi:MAG: sigma-70 family RNA polymerase sigma factor [Polyangiaceae bacterium]
MSPTPATAAAVPDRAQRERQRAFVLRHHGFVTRVLWSQGTPRALLDDGAQQVFLVALRDLDSIRDERAFLFGVASRVKKELVRAAGRHVLVDDPNDVDAELATEPSAEALLEQKRARELLDRTLEGLPEEVRVVFVLFEIEGLTLEEIASAIDVPRGTVSSRLRRGRELFQQATQRLRARLGKEVSP